MYSLYNDYLHVEIAPEGAELRSLFSKQQAREYIWQRDAAYWPKSSPLLFPVVGELRDGRYMFEEQWYKLPKHGFARERRFELLEQNEQEVAFVISSDEQSREMYPFDFRLIVRYTLQEHSLSCAYEVQNKGGESMYFSIGGQPAFQLDLSDGKHFSDYYLVFAKDHALTRFFLEKGLLNPQAEWQPLEGIRLPLRATMFDRDAWVLKDLRSSNVLLTNKQGDYRLDFQFSGFPYFALWGPVGAPFICLEPWCGVNDTQQYQGNFTNKEGIINLEGNGRWKRAWSITVAL